jgi:hypothetical protein
VKVPEAKLLLRVRRSFIEILNVDKEANVAREDHPINSSCAVSGASPLQDTTAAEHVPRWKWLISLENTLVSRTTKRRFGYKQPHILNITLVEHRILMTKRMSRNKRLISWIKCPMY